MVSNHSSNWGEVMADSIQPGCDRKSSMAVFQEATVASRTSVRSSTTRFWKSRRRRGVETQSFGREATFMKECNVSTTASRTVGIVCRKNGKSLGARLVSGNLVIKLKLQAGRVVTIKRTMSSYCLKFRSLLHKKQVFLKNISTQRRDRKISTTK